MLRTLQLHFQALNYRLWMHATTLARVLVLIRYIYVDHHRQEQLHYLEMHPLKTILQHTAKLSYCSWKLIYSSGELYWRMFNIRRRDANLWKLGEHSRSAPQYKSPTVFYLFRLLMQHNSIWRAQFCTAWVFCSSVYCNYRLKNVYVKIITKENRRLKGVFLWFL